MGRLRDRWTLHIEVRAAFGMGWEGDGKSDAGDVLLSLLVFSTLRSFCSSLSGGEIDEP